MPKPATHCFVFNLSKLYLDPKTQRIILKIVGFNVPIIIQNYRIILLKSVRISTGISRFYQFPFTQLHLIFDWYILLKPAFSIRAVLILVLYVIWNSSVLYILQHRIDLLVKEGRALRPLHPLHITVAHNG